MNDPNASNLRAGGVRDSQASPSYALGTILLASGDITRAQLDLALLHQKQTGRRLGEELMSAGHASRRQINAGLGRQRKLMAYALAVTVGLASTVPLAQAGQRNATVGVSVSVVAHARLTTEHQTTHLQITQADVERGFVEVPAASQFTVVTNSRVGYVLEFFPVGRLFDSVQVQGLGQEVQLGVDGGAIVRRGPLRGQPTHELSFRFQLHPQAVAGKHPWPLRLSVRALS